MLLARAWRRFSRSRIKTVLWTALFLLTFLDIYDAHHVARLLSRSLAIEPNLSPGRVFIASQHWNNAAILRSHWNKALIDLTEVLGYQNVYVSIYESGSWDDTKEALGLLDQELEARGIRRTITLDTTTHADDIARESTAPGWILTPRGKVEMRRIPYLARLRNLTLRPLEELAASGQFFDKVIFINDVVFMPTDILRLLDTNAGEYAAACSLDYAEPPNIYDTFALRDSEGNKHLTETWPYFRSRTSRSAILNNAPVPVRSCWNGIVAFDAAPFYDQNHPLRFRGLQDSLAASHLEASECCLIHADNKLSPTKGVWINPGVRVGYSGPAKVAVDEFYSTLSTVAVYKFKWHNRIQRWLGTDWSTLWTVKPRLRAWKSISSKNHEPGGYCIVNEMQVLVANGWAHV